MRSHARRDTVELVPVPLDLPVLRLKQRSQPQAWGFR